MANRNMLDNQAREAPRVALPQALTRQLIAYIGNKRRLLPFLAGVLHDVMPRGASSAPPAFLDLMAGSGSVSRLARHLGYRVSANDWEPFAFTVTAAHVENDPHDLLQLFPSHGIEPVIDELNAVGRSAAEDRSNPEGFIAANYAPAVTEDPQLGKERLFYSAENARFLDAVRDEIDRRFPPTAHSDRGRQRRILLALLIYEAATHANTSGVFKAYHRGFGGLSRDALSRILSPMSLEYPIVIDGPRGSAACSDAVAFARSHTGDVAYLDPPYNSHQYGSNYFMLNSILRWDKAPVNNERDSEGRLTKKAGIDPSWTATRSRFCSRSEAEAALVELMDAVDCRILVVSYSGQGILKAETIADLLSSYGAVTLHTTGYPAYRGGRQSLTRHLTESELVFVLRRGKEMGAERAQVSRALLEQKFERIVRASFAPVRLRQVLAAAGGELARGVPITTGDGYRIDSWGTVSHLSDDELHAAASRLEKAVCRDHQEEFNVLLSMAEEADGQLPRAYQRRMLACLRRYAHRKYHEQFAISVSQLRRFLVRRPDLSRLSEELDRLVRLADARFGGTVPGSSALRR